MTLTATGEISAKQRLGWATLTWALLFLATPGILGRDGSAVIAAFALVPWGLACSRPGKRAFAVELLAAFLGMTALCLWVTYVWGGTLLTVGVMPAIWVAFGGVVLRRLARRMPLCLAIPLAWTFGDTLRHFIEPPFSFGWMRHGLNLHHWTFLSGSARVWGVGGLSFCLAAVSGLAAQLLIWRAHPAMPRKRIQAFAIGTGPLLLALILSFVTRAPKMRPGPRLMLVQPSIPQSRKMGNDSRTLYLEFRDLTARELKALDESGQEPPDMVCWAETMFPFATVEPGVAARFGKDVHALEWDKNGWTSEILAGCGRNLDNAILYPFFGMEGGKRVPSLPRILPERTSFLTGAEYFLAQDGFLRRSNAVLMFDGEGVLQPPSGKRHLVPGGETMLGLERFAWIRDAAYAVAGYIPDLVAFDESVLQTLHSRDGEDEYRFTASVCFDNLYDDLYLEPLRTERVDFHLVCSNEAWFRETWEMDQMIAFSRVIAISTGRPVVRVTNSGVTCAIDADGTEVARLVVDGADRGRPGALTLTVPVPLEPDEAGRTVFVHTEKLWIALWILIPALLSLFLRPGVVTGPQSGVGGAESDLDEGQAVS